MKTRIERETPKGSQRYKLLGAFASPALWQKKAEPICRAQARNSNTDYMSAFDSLRHSDKLSDLNHSQLPARTASRGRLFWK